MASPFESPSPVETVESDDEVEVDDNGTPYTAAKLKPNLTGNLRKRQRKLTSSVWDHFVMIDELDNMGRMQCQCLKCGVKYIGESSHGTGNMHRHIKSCKGKV